MLKLAALGAALFASLALGPAHAGPAHAGPAHAGPAHAGPAHAGPAHAGPAHAGAAMPAQPSSFTVRLLTANGSGCPRGSATVSRLSSSAFTVRYSKFAAARGDGSSPVDFRKNCQLDTLVGVPAGWTFGVGEVDYRGYAHLGKGARGLVGAYYYFAGQPGTVSQTHQILGPTDRDYVFHDKATVVAYAPCATSVGLNVNTQLLSFAGSDPSYLNVLTMGSTRVSLGTVYHLVFRRCHP